MLGSMLTRGMEFWRMQFEGKREAQRSFKPPGLNRGFFMPPRAVVRSLKMEKVSMGGFC